MIFHVLSSYQISKKNFSCAFHRTLTHNFFPTLDKLVVHMHDEFVLRR